MNTKIVTVKLEGEAGSGKTVVADVLCNAMNDVPRTRAIIDDGSRKEEAIKRELSGFDFGVIIKDH